ncbi:hypothetical protein LRAMOSA05576 [Lichtheimia ramosa]|uniref:N-glycosylase/DNA lyase n=1 Tax=Lichtheimia ramosa TaxID=688394 RepID=A0A077X2A0_9FUNG|nr:hypothetical protein LRAMOSA05576 [Lichtheimia ramosa]
MTLQTIQTARLVWKDLKTCPKELHLDTLKCGQSFRWRQTKDLWSCILQGKLCVLRQTDSTVFYGALPEDDEHQVKQLDTLLRDYFQLDRVSLQSCYKRWSDLDANFKAKAIHFAGIRMLRQDPWENLVSFICSSNNNIPRITQMVNKLCLHYGSPICIVDDMVHYDFPSIQALAKDGVEQKLRELGFGYRAKYIAQTAQQILQKQQGEQWLWNLRNTSYAEAKAALVELAGVGPKVADCVCLMSLDHAEAIPVDTHVWQIALRDYGFKNKGGKTLTAKLYDQVADHFRQVFGDYSGWAHSVLFTADLRAFEDRIPKTEVKKEEIATSVKIEQHDNTVQVIETQKVIDKKHDGGGKRKRDATLPASRTVRRSTRIKRT